MLKTKRLLQLTIIVIVAIGFVYSNSKIKADPLTKVYDQLSRVTSNVVASHTIYLLTPSGISAGNSITITFPGSSFSFGGSYSFADMALASGSTSNCETATYTAKTLAASASGTTWGATYSSNVVTFTSATDTIASNVCIRINLNTNGAGHTLTNPNVTTNTVYNVNVSTTLDGPSQFAVIILGDASAVNVDQVTLSANIATSILMGIDTVLTNCNNNTQTTPANQSINFGALFPSIATYSTGTIPFICIEAGTNSVNGFRILVQSSRVNSVGGLVSTSGLITSATANLNSGGTLSGYGLRVSSTGTATIGSFTVSSPFNSATPGDVGGISGTLGTASQIITTTGPARSSSTARIAIEVGAKSSTTTPAESYTDTLNFTAFTNL